MPDHLEQWAKESDLDSYCNGIVPLMTPDGLFTGQAKIAYEFRWKKDDLLGAQSLIDAHKMIIWQMVYSIRELQRANQEKSFAWTRNRSNEDQIECGGDISCPLIPKEESLRNRVLETYPEMLETHFHDLAQYSIEET